MKKVEFKILFKKYWLQIIISLLSFYLSVTLAPVITMFNIFLFNSTKSMGVNIFSLLINMFTYKISIYSLLISVAAVAIFNKIYRNILVRRSALKILKAEYGSGNTFIDITNHLNDAIEGNKIKLILSNNIAGDPTPGIVKEGKIKYKFNNKVFDKKLTENQIIELP